MTITNFQSAVLVARQLSPVPPGFVATSTTSLLIGTGSKSFTTQAGTAYIVGSYIRLVSAANYANYMEGTVTSYSGSAMTVSISFIGPTASGTFADWSIVAAGSPGTGNLLSTNNLSDVANTTTARTNLGAGRVDTVTAADTSILVGGTTQNPTLKVNRTSVHNFLPNCQWQLWTSTGYITKQKENGTGAQTVVSVTSFDVSNGFPQFHTAATNELRVGDLVVISGGSYQWRYAGLGASSIACAVRVAGLITNSLFSVPGNFGAISPAASVAVVATPITPGDNGTGTGQSADGWKKTGTLTVWADDWASNLAPGAIRMMGIRKGSASAESMYWVCPPNQMAKYRGKTVTFGVLCSQKVQSGAGTWRVLAFDDVTGITASTAATGHTYVDPVYGDTLELKKVTATISKTATTFQLNTEYDGAAGDIYYLGLPTADFVPSLSRDDLRQNPNETIRPVGHWNPPLLTPLQITFPTTQTPLASGNYGWTGIDLEAISIGAVHKSVFSVKSKIEWLTSTLGAYILTGSKLDYSLTFGPQTITNVSGQNNVGQGIMDLADDGTFCVFSNVSGLVPTAGTWDFDNTELARTGSAN